MTPERWLRVKAVFQAVLDRPPDEQSTYLDQACDGDEGLRAQVLRLLAADGETRTPLEDRAWELGAELLTRSSETTLDGRRIGPHRILREIGRGGMGTVYLAVRDDGEYREEVAIKLIKRGMDTDAIIDRFRRERQILADLHHPSIARIFDGGVTEEGLPYFVMEYIEGEPIDAYCRAHGLDVSARLELFRAVCAAVQAAHRRLIVHCDLKPSNILVTREGVPKLVDFGVAKLLDPERGSMTLTLTASERLLTPKYASPEQVRGEPLTTATDVYSLGVVLYELLTGQQPYRFQERSRREIERVICEQEPEKLSTVVARGDAAPEKLRRRLLGDLDNIVLMALRKEPEKRYGSAEQLAEDVRRHLDGLPVLARRPTPGYRAGKFLRRHRLAALAAFLVLSSLVAGIVATAWQAGEARRQERTAERSLDFMGELFKLSDPGDAEYGTLTLRDVLDRGAEKITRELRDEPLARARLMDVLGSVYRDLGHFDEAEPLLAEALEIRQREPGAEPREVAESLHNLGILRYRQVRYEDAEPLLHRALELRRRLPGDAHREVAESLNGIALLQQARGEYEEAEAGLREALELRRELSPETPQLAISLSHLAQLLRRRQAYDEAEALYRETLALRRRVLPEGHPMIAKSLNNLAFFLFRARGQVAEAEALYRQALAIYRRHPEESSQYPTLLSNLAALLSEQGQEAEAEELYREALELQRRFDREERGNTITARNNLAASLFHQGELEAAEQLFREVLELNREKFGDDPERVPGSMRNLGTVLQARGDGTGAEELFREALSISRRRLGPEHSQVADALVTLGKFLLEGGRYPEAEERLREGWKIRRDSSQPPAKVARAASLLGASLAARGRLEEAEPYLLEGAAVLEAEKGLADKHTQEALAHLVALYEAWNRPAHVERHRARLQP